jgi:hypothetical protein
MQATYIKGAENAIPVPEHTHYTISAGRGRHKEVLCE